MAGPKWVIWTFLGPWAIRPSNAILNFARTPNRKYSQKRRLCPLLLGLGITLPFMTTQSGPLHVSAKEWGRD